MIGGDPQCSAAERMAYPNKTGPYTWQAPYWVSRDIREE